MKTIGIVAHSAEGAALSNLSLAIRQGGFHTEDTSSATKKRTLLWRLMLANVIFFHSMEYESLTRPFGLRHDSSTLAHSYGVLIELPKTQPRKRQEQTNEVMVSRDQRIAVLGR